MPTVNKKNFRISLDAVEAWSSPYEALTTGRTMLKAWSESLPEDQRLSYGRSFVYYLIKQYWEKFYPASDLKFNLPNFNGELKFRKLNVTLHSLAESLGNSASKLSLIEANFHIGAIYSATIPNKVRAEKGIYFTPPLLTNRLLQLIEQQGIQWGTARILDPACGGGAFLAPVALQIVSSVSEDDPNRILAILENNLKGYEIDFFSAWLSQVFVEIVVSKYCLQANRRLKSLVDVCNSIERDSKDQYDVIIGNPPYGKITLEPELRERYRDSLYGHANLYGLFTHLALQKVKKGGVIAYVTPTGFLAGEYFKNLRKLILSQASPRAFDFVSFRKGVFEDVLQETMLACYKKEEAGNHWVEINEIHPNQNNSLETNNIGRHKLPVNGSAVWILPRTPEQSSFIHSFEKLRFTLKDWGYEVKTGQLVWNRHKDQLTNTPSEYTFPLIWAEAIGTDGKFQWKADKKNHTLFYTYKQGQDWVLVNYPCIVLQRTTSKEQDRRLMAALIPEHFIQKHGAVVIENHINIIKPVTATPKVSLKLLAAFLNSEVADMVFRCISGSVAVSAYELESMPVPNPEGLKGIENMINTNNSKEAVQNAFRQIYGL
ncbi:HsdM family class I SAM-dependent methyltransferase [Pseudocnuella soli]|uniref:HsdM family class I SAM-dependent methyltransferase n=1 Tax=Pseudocnuella soli TaxID=2502779 RepID=UPI0010480381|nr:N-6 DNA methylase [Pseudocnuella soli]